MPVPVSKNTPCGKDWSRKSQPTSSSKERLMAPRPVVPVEDHLLLTANPQFDG